MRATATLEGRVEIGMATTKLGHLVSSSPFWKKWRWIRPSWTWTLRPRPDRRRLWPRPTWTTMTSTCRAAWSNCHRRRSHQVHVRRSLETVNSGPWMHIWETREIVVNGMGQRSLPLFRPTPLGSGRPRQRHLDLEAAKLGCRTGAAYAAYSMTSSPPSFFKRWCHNKEVSKSAKMNR